MKKDSRIIFRGQEIKIKLITCFGMVIVVIGCYLKELNGCEVFLEESPLTLAIFKLEKF